MRNDFSVRFALEGCTGLGKLGTNLAVVLDDAVVNNDDGANLVRMGVSFNRLTVCGPSRMSNAYLAR